MSPHTALSSHRDSFPESGEDVPAPTPGGPYRVEIDTVPDATWDEIVASFADSHHEQTACYAANHWKGRNSHLLLRKDGVPVAGARAAIIKLPVIGRGLAFVRFGPFWRRKDREADPNIYRAVVDALVEEYSVKRGHCLTILPRPNPDYHALECCMLRDAGFAQRREIMDKERYLVDASLAEEAQLASLNQKWRYNLRQALANSLEVRLCEAPHEIAAFQSLYDEMVSRKNFTSTTPVHMTGALIEGLPPKLKPRLVLVWHEGKPIAGATIGLFGDTAYYMFGASAAEALPLKAGYALHWWILGWLRSQGIRWYDLGGAAHEPGLRQFKKALVGKAGRIVELEGEYDHCASSLGRLATDAIFGARHLERLIRHGTRYGQAADPKS
jgi:hypothetical protein